MSNLPEPMIELFEVEPPNTYESERYFMDPQFHNRVQLVWRQQLAAWMNLRKAMSKEESDLFEEKLLWLSMHIVTNSTMEVRVR